MPVVAPEFTSLFFLFAPPQNDMQELYHRRLRRVEVLSLQDFALLPVASRRPSILSSNTGRVNARHWNWDVIGVDRGLTALWLKVPSASSRTMGQALMCRNLRTGPLSAPCPSFTMSSRSLLDVLGELVLHPVNRRAPLVNDKANSKTPCIPFLPQSTRFLRNIVALEMEQFHALVSNYTAAWPPTNLSKQQASYFAVPHPKNLQFPSTFRVDLDYSIYLNAVLNATNRTLEFIDGSPTARMLGTDLEGKLLCGWSHIIWGKAHPSEPRLTKVEVVIVTMPAWCFTSKDMADFTNVQSYVNPASPSEEKKMSTAAKLWARLHDFCYGHDARYFIVATYEQWAFGCFSPFWRTGYVAPPMKFDSKAPTVIQAAMYWLDSARDHPQGYHIPEACEQPGYHEYPLRYNDWAVPRAQAAYILASCS